MRVAGCEPLWSRFAHTPGPQETGHSTVRSLSIGDNMQFIFFHNISSLFPHIRINLAYMLTDETKRALDTVCTMTNYTFAFQRTKFVSPLPS